MPIKSRKNVIINSGASLGASSAPVLSGGGQQSVAHDIHKNAHMLIGIIMKKKKITSSGISG